ncbi:MAG: hypothetical protein DMG79_13425 [Acidobacteria bacterium]|nr:MAG: hypothetical protein DMG79_13425 [Acidobacteriota bacterium]
MKKLWVVACSILLIASLVALCPQPTVLAQSAATPNAALVIGANQVAMTNAQLNPNENYQVIRAFVRTGVLSPNCLATLGETTYVANGTIIFCAPRQPVGLGRGVLVSVFYPQPPPSDLFLSITLFQEGAKSYASPVLCNVSGC